MLIMTVIGTHCDILILLPGSVSLHVAVGLVGISMHQLVFVTHK